MKTRCAKYRLARVLILALHGLLALAGCEAPLNLAGVEQELARSSHGFDHFKGVATNGGRVVAASDAGVLLVADAGAQSWQRVQLSTKASFVNLAACPNRRFVAIDSLRTLWVSDAQGANWQARPVATQESLMGLACDVDNRVWVGASFSTLLTSSDFGETWNETSQDEDLMFTAIQAFDDGLIVAAGEFGTVIFSQNRGETWDRAEPLPNEFYPMGLYFRDRQTGWVGGLSGTILHTSDGGTTWQRQASGTSAPLYNFAANGDRLFATGDNGTLLELREGQWQPVPLAGGTTAYLIGAVAVDPQTLLVVGGAGTLATIDLIPDAGRVAGRGDEQ